MVGGVALKSLAGGRLFGTACGQKPPRVLALHGWGRSHRDFSAALEGLDAIAVDLPGFGASPPPEAAIGAHGYAEIVASVLSHFDRPPVVVGHSFGGRVAVALESDAPGSFAGMVLTGVPLVMRAHTSKPPLGYRVVKAANRLGIVSDERLEREKRSRGSVDYRSATGVMRDVLVTAVNESYERELAAIDLPVRLLWGERDTEVPVEVAERAMEILGERASLSIVERGGHLLPVTDPDRVRAEIEALL